MLGNLRKCCYVISITSLLGGRSCEAIEPAAISGLVTTAAGIPLSHAAVILVFPPRDAADYLSQPDVFSGSPKAVAISTDEQGAFHHSVLVDAVATRVSVTATKPGYLSAREDRDLLEGKSSEREIEPDKNAAYLKETTSVQLISGKVTHVSFRLKAGRLITGRLVDDLESPFAGAWILVDGGERVKTDAQGRFSATASNFDHESNIKRVDRLRFARGDILPGQEYQVPVDYDSHRPPLNVVLHRGHTISGDVSSSEGQPLQNCSVEARYEDRKLACDRSCVTTDKGQFSLTGLSKGRITLIARSLEQKERVIAHFDVARDVNNLSLQLEEAIKWDVPTVEMLGVQVVRLTKAVNDLHQFPRPKGMDYGLVVVDPGRDTWSISKGVRLLPGDLILGVTDEKESIGLRSLSDLMKAISQRRPDHNKDVVLQILIGRLTENGILTSEVKWNLSARQIDMMKN